MEDSRNCMQSTNTAGNKTNHVSGRFKRNSDNFDQGGGPMLAQHHSYLGEGSGAIPEFPEICFNTPLPDDCSMEDVDTLR